MRKKSAIARDSIGRYLSSIGVAKEKQSGYVRSQCKPSKRKGTASTDRSGSWKLKLFLGKRQDETGCRGKDVKYSPLGNCRGGRNLVVGLGHVEHWKKNVRPS